MTLDVRRVVVEHDENGKSVVSSDEILPAQPVAPQISIRGCELWVTDTMPVDNSARTAAGQRTGSLERFGDLYVGNGQGSACRVTLFPPGVTRVFHRTETLDYDIILNGEIDLVLDGEEAVHLTAGDVAIVRGSLHAWSNQGSEPAAVAFIMLDAKPVLIAGQTLGKDYPTFPGSSST